MVSGEQLQSLAEISLYGEMTDLIQSQIKSKPQNLVKISDLSPDDITKYKTIYVYTHFLNEFFDKFHDKLEQVTLITNNSDEGIHNHHLKYLDGNNIKRWYCQNRETSHPKLSSIPIGLANSQWIHGNQELINSIREEQLIKKNLVFKNFDVGTNCYQRNKCNDITSLNGIELSPSTSIDVYWRNIAESIFVISPPGNGIDCHRIWETLYLRSVPIILKHESFSQFHHLPILFVDNWEQVTIDFLISKIEEFTSRNFDLPELTLPYWRSIINIQ